MKHTIIATPLMQEIDSKDKYIQFIKDSFSPLALEPLGEISTFCETLKSLLCFEVRDKILLLDYIDRISIFLASSSSKNPYVGLLFEGSISHLLKNLLSCALSIQNNDIYFFMENAKRIICECIDGFLEEYKCLTNLK